MPSSSLLTQQFLDDELAGAENFEPAHYRFLQKLSAQLRTSLNTMQGFAQLLSMQSPDTLADTQRDRLVNIELACQRMHELVDSVRDLSLTDPECALPLQPVDLHAQVREAVTLVTPQADVTGVHFQVQFPDGPAGALAEPRALGQVLRNLLSNAVKYNRPNGLVTVTVRVADERCRLAVTDEGQGMSADELERLFQPFSRLARTAGGTHGFGLGLSITRALVYRMGGAIEVWSHPGHGSTFELTLDRAMNWSDQARAASPDIAATPHTGLLRTPRDALPTSFRVLCVEDDGMNRLLAQTMLERLNDVDWQVASDGRQAIELIRRRAPDLVICDMHLPDLDGADLIKRVRQAGLAPNTRWIAVSADSHPTVAQQASDAGYQAFWLKPLDIHQVIGTVRELAASLALTQRNTVAADGNPRV